MKAAGARAKSGRRAKNVKSQSLTLLPAFDNMNEAVYWRHYGAV
jgi:hypothetical protein